MITHIKKRDGSIQEFSPTKINGWGEWAAKRLGPSVDWGSVVIDAVNRCPTVCSSLDLQTSLIETCLARKSWEYNKMAGRLYAALINKELYPNGKPSIKQLHERLHSLGLMVRLNYTDQEYTEAEKIIDHKLDLTYPHYQLNQLRFKYAIRNKITGDEYESAQFVYMRMAMALSENEPAETKMQHVAAYYGHFSHNRINAPTPYFVNLGTKLNGFASCCLYTTDDTAASLAAGDHIAYMMTCMSAGIGTHIKTRSLGDPVRGGLIQHQGKLPYYRAMVGAIGANLQNGRGGASTVHYNAFDPEVEVIQKLRHPMTPLIKKISGCHYSFGNNKLFARKVARNETFAPFSYYDNVELYEAMYEKDQSKFEKLYTEYEKTAKVKLNARDIVLGALTQAYETGVHYMHNIDIMNTHTPFNDKLYLSNLCQEIQIAVKPYSSVAELYKPQYEEGDGEIGLCSLAGIIVGNIDNDEQYADAAYYTLKMIDTCIHKSDYVFPNLEHTAKARLSAGVGIIGLAHLMAKHDKKYDTQDGRNFIHEISETHMWHLINASLRLGKELGNAPWMHKTLWPKGWLPIDTYEKRVDELVTVDNKRDWETLRKQIIENGGIRNSVVAAHMPSESSSISAGTTNGLYPIRDLYIMKTNDTMVNHWAAPDGTKLKNRYQSAWTISTSDMIKCYAIIQKWTDQGISADLFVQIQDDAKISSTQMLQDYLDMVKYGIKTRYYVNSLTSKGINLSAEESALTKQETVIANNDSADCESCTL
jgi:ribonucleoside-diphosphate reductase alpha chain